MTKYGQVCVLESKQKLSMRRYPVPEPEPGTVLIEMELCGVCGTDVHYYHADLPKSRYPLLLGHENVGRIVALGAGLDTDFLQTPVKVGDRVVPTGAAPAGMPCGRCYYCAVVRTPNKCIGGISLQNADHFPHFTGGYAEYLYLQVPGSPFFKTGLPQDTAVLLEPLTATIHAADRSRIRLGDTVVIQGSGAMGLLALVCARMSGAVRTMVVGGPGARLALAEELGADITIDISKVADPNERSRLIRESTPGGFGADVVFECAGVPEAINEGLSYLREGGTFVEVGHFVDTGKRLTVNPAADLVRRNINIVAPFASSVEHYARGLRILEQGAFPFSRMISHTIPLDRTDDAIMALSSEYSLDGKDTIKICVSTKI